MIAFGIAGTGWMADRMAQAMVASPQVKIVRVASSSDDRARECAVAWGGGAHGDFAALLADPMVEAIYVAGHNRSHAPQSLAALQAGKAVLCEKPFAMGLGEAKQIVTAAQRAGRLYMEAIAPPFLPVLASARGAAARQGAVRRVEASFGYPASRAEHPALYGAGGGVLADRAVYPLMLALILLGPVRSSRMSVDRDAEGLDIAARFTLDHAGGGTSELAVSLVARLANSLTIESAEGVVQIAPPLLTAKRIVIGRWARTLSQNPLARRLADLAARLSGRWHDYGANPYRPELDHFCGQYLSGAIESPIVSHERMIEVVRLIEEARAA